MSSRAQNTSGLAGIIAKAIANPRRIVLAEGEDPRVVRGAILAREAGLAEVILLGTREKILAELAQQGGREDARLTISDPRSSPHRDACIAAFFELRKHKGMTPERAKKEALEPLNFAAVLVHLGHADGTVAGAVATTHATVAAAIRLIGKAPKTPLVSSFFLMEPNSVRHPDTPSLLFSDCALVVEPDAEQLANIALASAESYARLVGAEPRVALLSFSSHGSARHAAVGKVFRAAEIAKAARPDLLIDGDLQFDAAFVPEVAAAKVPRSPLAGGANVFIFPSLEAGNISYKIAQRLGGMRAVGPILQGLKKPANDLSRGCSAEDVLHLIAVTSAQAAQLDEA